MTPDEMESLLRTARPEVPASLRARVLAAAATVPLVAPIPWWAQVRTWAAAAMLAIAVDAAVLAWPQETSATTAIPTMAQTREADDVEAVPRPMPVLAWIVPAHVSDPNVPTPRSTLAEIYR